MSKQVFVFPSKAAGVSAAADFILDWCAAHPRAALGGATGRSPIGVWKTIWDRLSEASARQREDFLARDVVFLDEYFGPYPSYYHWAWRNLRVGRGGFSADRIFTPRGCFFEENRPVSSRRLEEILAEWPDQWEARTLPGEDGQPPQVRIGKSADHPVLAEIRQALDDYERLARDHYDRMQLLGIGVGGAIEHDRAAGGHIGFVEYGAADGDSQTMLVRLAPSTQKANQDDFHLSNGSGAVHLEPSSFAVTQGVSTILSAAQLLMMAWGESKRQAIRRMFLGEPGPKNPAAWLQTHDGATVLLDRAALGELHPKSLEERGWSVAFDPVSLAAT